MTAVIDRASGICASGSKRCGAVSYLWDDENRPSRVSTASAAADRPAMVATPGLGVPLISNAFAFISARAEP
jgi:hypothetical protein